jgi:hypothetical protein
MDSISLAEMDAHALMNRTDTKYVFGAERLSELLGSVGHAYRVLSVDTVRLSPYETLYFDTPGHECFLQHHNGKLNRRKYRIRQYQSSGACFLEVKAKTNKGRTDKRRIPIGGFEDPLTPTSRDFIESTTGSLPELIPQLWSYFLRITLVNRHQPERATFDLNLRFRDGDDQAELPGIVIAEVKQQRDDRHSCVREYLRKQAIRPLRVSKYCLGTAMLKPHLKSNRFKPKLLAIRKIA